MKLATTLLILMLATGCMLCQNACGNCDGVTVGDSIDCVRDQAGTPYQVVNCGNGRLRYVYISHSDPVRHVQSMQKCILEIENGVVTDKWHENEDYEDVSVMDEQMFPKY